MKLKVFSWNLNGIRAAARNGFFTWLESEAPDVLLLQEVRCAEGDLQPDWLAPFGYRSLWCDAEKKGYSGVGIYTRLPIKEAEIFRGVGQPSFDSEGRVVAFAHNKVLFVSAYFPNSQRAGVRLQYKIDFCDYLLSWLNAFREQGYEIIIGGDFNIAHTPIDLANPKQNEKNAGYLPEERQWMSKFIENGFVDSFRMFEKGGGHYTWWSQRPGIRERNIGWRLDYHFITPGLVERVTAAKIFPSVKGSDHCPVSLELQLE